MVITLLLCQYDNERKNEKKERKKDRKKERKNERKKERKKKERIIINLHCTRAQHGLSHISPFSIYQHHLTLPNSVQWRVV